MAGDYFIRYNSESKFSEPVVADFNPRNLKWLKGSYTGGDIQQQQALFAAMMREWSCLRKDVGTMQNAIATLTYKAMPYCEEGEEPTPRAQEVAKLVNDALWRRSDAESGTWVQGFQEMIASCTMVSCAACRCTRFFGNMMRRCGIRAGIYPLCRSSTGGQLRAGSPTA